MDPPDSPWRVVDAPAGATRGAAPPDEALGTPLTIVVLGLLVAAGLAIGAVVLASSGPEGGGVEVIAADPAGTGILVVQVTGAVARPGVYQLAAGARVADAISAAGGFGPRVAADRAATELDLAARLKDGDRVTVPSRDDAPGGTPAASGERGGLLDLNAASAAELEALPGIGPVTAARIIEARGERSFASVDELRERGLVGEKTFGAIRELVTVR